MPIETSNIQSRKTQQTKTKTTCIQRDSIKSLLITRIAKKKNLRNFQLVFTYPKWVWINAFTFNLLKPMINMQEISEFMQNWRVFSNKLSIRPGETLNMLTTIGSLHILYVKVSIPFSLHFQYRLRRSEIERSWTQLEILDRDFTFNIAFSIGKFNFLSLFASKIGKK